MGSGGGGRSRRVQVAVVVGVLVAAAAAGVLGGLVAEWTGQVWLRYVPMVPVIVVGVLVLRGKAKGPGKEETEQGE